MQRFNGYLIAKAHLQGAALAIGNFDGVHLGHVALLERAKFHARELGTRSAVYTFSPHPSRVLQKTEPPPLISTEEQKLQSIAHFGVDAAIIEAFTPDLAKVSADDFILQILWDALHVKAVVVGANFRFGHKAQGDVGLLQALLEPRDVIVDVVEPITIEGAVCASSTIRALVAAGDVAQAAKLLGRPYALSGTVVRGAGRGRTIGVPSANLEMQQELVPGVGVYATRVTLNGHKEALLGATNVGHRPTFGVDAAIYIETHVLNFTGDVYGQNMSVEFLRKIRDEKKFASADALKAQIAQDIAAISLATPD